MGWIKVFLIHLFTNNSREIISLIITRNIHETYTLLNKLTLQVLPSFTLSILKTTHKTILPFTHHLEVQMD